MGVSQGPGGTPSDRAVSPHAWYVRRFYMPVTTPPSAARRRRRLVRGNGHLCIAPGYLVYELGGFTSRLAGIAGLRHKGNLVYVYRSRLVMPWLNVSVRVDDGQTALIASTWCFGLRTLIDALETAGFVVEYHPTWIYRGIRHSQVGSGPPHG